MQKSNRRKIFKFISLFEAIYGRGNPLPILPPRGKEYTETGSINKLSLNNIRKMVFSKIIIGAKHNHGASYNIKNKAKTLRRDLTYSEKILWSYLRRRQQKKMHFRRQHPYGIYILDFFCFEAKLAIEVDGEIHQNQIEYDEERTTYLESSGLKVLRFKNQDIENNIQDVIEQINKNLIRKLE